MSLLLFLLFGLVVGLIARAITPGRQHMGLALTAVVGIVGSFIGGFVSSLLSGENVLELHKSGIIGSIIGAVVLLLILQAVSPSLRNRMRTA
jgi:uncharacterized membrane protein YeaQ/YmgE (transglycosylase-associated protein family)